MFLPLLQKCKFLLEVWRFMWPKIDHTPSMIRIFAPTALRIGLGVPGTGWYRNTYDNNTLSPRLLLYPWGRPVSGRDTFSPLVPALDPYRENWLCHRLPLLFMGMIVIPYMGRSSRYCKRLSFVTRKGSGVQLEPSRTRKSCSCGSYVSMERDRRAGLLL